MSLLETTMGLAYIVENLELEGMICRRLQALGLTKGTRIKVLNHKKNGTLIFKVRGTRLAVGRKIASQIMVLEVQKG